MSMDDFQVLITSPVSPADEDEFTAEIVKRLTDHRAYEFGSVRIKNGRPFIHIVPNEFDPSGEWTLEYATFRRIVQVLDEFLESIGYSPEEPDSTV